MGHTHTHTQLQRYTYTCVSGQICVGGPESSVSLFNWNVPGNL